jgi:hypothetical protein
VEPDLVRLRRSESPPLLRPDVDDRGTRERQRAAQRLEQGMELMARYRADVRDPEVLE